MKLILGTLYFISASLWLKYAYKLVVSNEYPPKTLIVFSFLALALLLIGDFFKWSTIGGEKNATNQC